MEKPLFTSSDAVAKTCVSSDCGAAYTFCEKKHAEIAKAITTAATAIYERLHSFSSFAPIEARCVCDWTVQSGDIISIMDGDQKFSLPIYAQTISWKGGARVVYENSGSNKRPKQKGSRYSGNIATMKGDAMIRNLKRTIKQMSEQLNTVKEAVNAADK